MAIFFDNLKFVRIFSGIFCFLPCFAYFTKASFAQNARQIAADLASKGEARQILGEKDGEGQWIFLRNEVNHLADDNFWNTLENPDSKFSKAFDAIDSYRKKLEEVGAHLLLVLVPPKADIYPEKLTATLSGEVFSHQKIFDAFANRGNGGIDFLNLEKLYLAEKQNNPQLKLYCLQDSHWSPIAAKMAAEKVVKHLRAKNIAITPKLEGEVAKGEKQILKINGDLSDKENFDFPPETLEIFPVGKKNADSYEILETEEGAKNAELIVLSDSHGLVFSEGGDMHCRAAGFVDHLQYQLKSRVALFANRASGGHSARMSLARHIYQANSESDVENSFWLDASGKGKRKVVVWLFSARELSLGKWQDVPINP